MLVYLTTSWLHNGSSTLPNGATVFGTSNASVSLTFDPVSVAQEGVYTCVSTLNIPDVPLMTSDAESYVFAALGTCIIHVYYKDKKF